MLKQSIIYLVISILLVLFAEYAHALIVYIVMFYTYVMIQLTPIFNAGSSGILFRKIIVLTLLPVIIVGIPALIYRAIKGRDMPYFFESVWFLWLIIVLSKVVVR
ncbi:MAG TPA: hypothetical protein DDY37_05915 [Legionella sp.]|nr:hypothetical protein [Legionella sp.]